MTELEKKEEEKPLPKDKSKVHKTETVEMENITTKEETTEDKLKVPD